MKCYDVFPGVDENADASDGQSLPSEGVEHEAAVVLSLAALSELGPGQSSTRHHLPHLAVPRHQRPLQEQPVSLSQHTGLWEKCHESADLNLTDLTWRPDECLFLFV